MANKILTQYYLNLLFEYKDGNLYWKNHTYKAWNGKKAGCVKGNEYSKTRLLGVSYLTHRLIFLYHFGYLPTKIDHIDGNKLNNLVTNLRVATNQENGYNSKKTKANKSGYKNVYFHKPSKMWLVQISCNFKRKSIGYYKDIELADLVAQEARDKYHKQFARHF